MNSSNKIVSEVTEDGVKITTYEDGSLHFQPIEVKIPIIETDNRSIWKKIKDWWNDTLVKPYVKIRDLADPFNDRTDPDAGSDGKQAIEIGIKVDF